MRGGGEVGGPHPKGCRYFPGRGIPRPPWERIGLSGKQGILAKMSFKVNYY